LDNHFAPKEDLWGDDAQEKLADMIANEEFEKALSFYIENRADIPIMRRRFYLSCIQDGLENHKTYRRLLPTAILMLVINILVHPLFYIQLFDVLSFLSHDFLYYHYFSAAVPHVLNVLFVVGLLIQWHLWVRLPAKLFRRRIQMSYRVGFLVLVLLASGYLAWQLAPLARDLPMVLEGQYNTHTITEEDAYLRIWSQAVQSAPQEHQREYLIRKLVEEFGWEYGNTDFLPHYHSVERGLLDVMTLHTFIDGKDGFLTIRELPLRAMQYEARNYPITIKYLPNSRIILQIINE